MRERVLATAAAAISLLQPYARPYGPCLVTVGRVQRELTGGQSGHDLRQLEVAVREQRLGIPAYPSPPHRPSGATGSPPLWTRILLVCLNRGSHSTEFGVCL